MHIHAILIIILYLGVVIGNRIHLVPGDLINIQLLEELHREKSWTIYIDELISNFPDTNTLESIYKNLSTAVALAKDWCSFSNSYIGAYQDASVNTPMIARYNVTDWLPCGVIIVQYHKNPTTVYRTVFIVQVNQQFFINASILESDLKTSSIDWKQPTYMPNGENGIFLEGTVDCYSL